MKYKLINYYGGVQPNLKWYNNRCFGDVVLQMIYRATDIREYILENNYDDKMYNKIKDDLSKMKEIDIKTGENLPIVRLDNNFEKCTAIWEIQRLEENIDNYKYGISNTVLNKILQNMYKKNVYSDAFTMIYIMPFEELQEILKTEPSISMEIAKKNGVEIKIGMHKNYKDEKYIFCQYSAPNGLSDIYEELILEHLKYKLISFYVVLGSHYIAYINNPYNNEWLEYNDMDENIKVIDIKNKKVPIGGFSCFCYERVDGNIIDLICNIIHKSSY